MKKLLGLLFTLILAVTLFACDGATTAAPTTAAPTTAAPTTAAPTTAAPTTAAPEKYSEGVYFEGVQLLGDYEFSLTIDPEELPYYYETLYAAYGPMPMHVLAPSYAYIDSGDDGATLIDAYAKIDDIIAVDGYRYYPTVTAGPYKFVSFVNQVVTVVIDPLFKGDYNGHLPTIEKIIQKRINQTTDVQQVIDGEVDLVTGVIEGAKIQAAIAASTTGTHFFNRNGYGLLAMTCDFGPTMDVKVRQAVAHLTDRNYVTQQVLEGYGSVVFSEYGAAQWMFQEADDEGWVEDNLEPYALSVDSANDLLDDTEWKFESDGTTAWDASEATATNEYYRYNEDGEVLELKHFGTENNTVTDSLRDKFVQNMPLAGIKFSTTIGTFDTLLDHFYFGFELGEDRTYHLFNLATNFDTAFDPYYSWHSDFLNTWYNSQGVDDEDLDTLIMELRSIDPTSATARADYLAKWKEYQVRWNYLIPSVPLYSNQYYQVFDVALLGVDTMTPFYDWSAAICDIMWTTDTANDELIVGVPEMNGEFMTGFGNSSYDNWIRGLIFGYGTYAVTPGGEVVLNPTVVEDLEVVENDDDSKTYTFTIADDLLWSDGVPITAADFVFSVLFQASAEWARAGATSAAGQGLLGYDVYATGEPLAE
ncbi:MAG: ABC transporter substrate-binding protein [Candidatus Izemoplasmatales bacterium]|nr:ABC transporter substrate-binding protein [Candidatus Izemoplasmatales bacterium]